MALSRAVWIAVLVVAALLVPALGVASPPCSGPTHEVLSLRAFSADGGEVRGELYMIEPGDSASCALTLVLVGGRRLTAYREGCP